MGRRRNRSVNKIGFISFLRIVLAIVLISLFIIILLIMSLPSLIRRAIKGDPSKKCWNCKSENVITRGFKKNRRYECEDCGYIVKEVTL